MVCFRYIIVNTLHKGDNKDDDDDDDNNNNNNNNNNFLTSLFSAMSTSQLRNQHLGVERKVLLCLQSVGKCWLRK